jgi:hypothetical protein
LPFQELSWPGFASTTCLVGASGNFLEDNDDELYGGAGTDTQTPSMAVSAAITDA